MKSFADDLHADWEPVGSKAYGYRGCWVSSEVTEESLAETDEGLVSRTVHFAWPGCQVFMIVFYGGANSGWRNYQVVLLKCALHHVVDFGSDVLVATKIIY